MGMVPWVVVPVNALPAVVGAWKHLEVVCYPVLVAVSLLAKNVMQQAHVDVPAKRLMPMIKLGEMLTNPSGTAVHSLYVFSSNPAITAPDQNVVRRADERWSVYGLFTNDSLLTRSKYADIVLPATTSVEHDDIYNSYGHYTIGTGYKLINPIGESRSNWQVRFLN